MRTAVMIRELTPEDRVIYEETLTWYIFESVKNSAYMGSFQMRDALLKCGELRTYLDAGKAIS